jgi:hypothetical protein
MAKKKQPTGKKEPVKAKKAPVKAKKAPAKAMTPPVPAKKVQKVPKKTPAKTKKTKPKKTQAKTEKTFSVVQFSEMTYLTVKGVNEWLKQGKLKGDRDNKGNWLVDAASLQLPYMKKLIR